MNMMMKRMILALWALLAVIQLSAQSGYGINPVFDGKVIPSSRIKETYINGTQLAPYKLRVFRSVKFTATPAELSRIQALLLEDGKGAEDRQTEYTGAEIHSTRYDMPTEGNKYLCLQVFPKGGRYDVTLVYMSGDATLDELKRLFKN